MREKVKLNGKPVEVTLAYSTGKESRNDSGAFFTYTLSDNQIMFAKPALNEIIQNLHPYPGMRLSIELLADKEWEVKQVDPPTSGPRIAPSVNSQAVAEDPSKNTQHSNGTRQETLTQLGSVLVHGIPGNRQPASSPKPAAASLMTGQSQFCLQQLIAAIEAVHAAEKYALAMNRPVTFTSEDIRAFAISCFIQQHKGTY